MQYTRDPHRQRSSRSVLPEPLEPRRLLTTWYVDASAPAAPTPTGASWSAAYPDLQLALVAATPGDTIKIAQGTYKPTATTDRTISFALKPGVALYGGYAGLSSPTPDARNNTVYPTTLSGDIGTPGVTTDNSCRILSAVGTDPAAVLDGFTVAAARGTLYNSGALYVANGTLTVSNCTFTANTTPDGDGAALYLTNASPTFLNCSFTNNSSLGYGGAAYAVNGTPSFTGCSFVGNSGGNYGGAFYGAATFTSCTFSNNTIPGAYGRGGALNLYGGAVVDSTFTGNSASVGGAVAVIYGSSSPEFTRCAFTANTATGGDGGAVYTSGYPAFTNCSFVRNSAPTADGGALSISISSGSDAPKLTACTFYGNSALNGGAVRAVSPASAKPLFASCAFVGNFTTVAFSLGGAMFVTGPSNVTSSTFIANSTFGTNGTGGAVYTQSTTTTLTNSILYGNTANASPQLRQPSNSTAPTYCVIQGGYAGTGNLSSDPLFSRTPGKGADNKWGTADDNYGDLRLSLFSPAVDAGLNAAVPATVTTDLAGNPRVFDSPGTGTTGAVVDIGAHEAGTDLGALTIPAGKSISLTAGGHTFSATSLTIPPTSSLNLVDSTLVLTTGAPQQTAASIRDLIRAARLTSSTPNPAGAYSIGYRPNDAATSLVIKRALIGDANLDNALDPDDLLLTDRGLAMHLSTWYSGDFDHDGAVTAADLALLDARYVLPMPEATAGPAPTRAIARSALSPIPVQSLSTPTTDPAAADQPLKKKPHRKSPAATKTLPAIKTTARRTTATPFSTLPVHPTPH